MILLQWGHPAKVWQGDEKVSEKNDAGFSIPGSGAQCAKMGFIKGNESHCVRSVSEKNTQGKGGERVRGPLGLGDKEPARKLEGGRVVRATECRAQGLGSPVRAEGLGGGARRPSHTLICAPWTPEAGVPVGNKLGIAERSGGRGSHNSLDETGKA